MVYRKYVNNKKFRIYEFEYFDLKDIEEFFNGKRIWRIGKFQVRFIRLELEVEVMKKEIGILF